MVTVTHAKLVAAFQVAIKKARAAGINVVEMPGWKSRIGNSKKRVTSLYGVVFHHTGSEISSGSAVRAYAAGLSSGRIRPDIGAILCNTTTIRPGAYPGSSGGRCTIVVNGADYANHAGLGDRDTLAKLKAGTVPLTSEIHPNSNDLYGNEYLLGDEGMGAYRSAEQNRDARLFYSFVLAELGLSGSPIIGHREWSPRKNDPARTDMARVRQDYLALSGQPIDPPKRGDRLLSKDGNDTGQDVADLAELLVSLGYDVGTPAGVFGPKMDAAVRALQEAAGITVDGVVGPDTLKALDAALLEAAQKPEETEPDPTPDPEPTPEPDTSGDVMLRVGSYNSQMPQWGGNKNYRGDGIFLRDKMACSVYFLQEVSGAARNAIRSVLGPEWKLWTTGLVAVLWDSTKYKHGDPVEFSFGTIGARCLMVPLTSKKNGRKFWATVVHIRPKDAMPRSWSDARKLKAKQSDVRKAIKLVSGRDPVVMGGDWNTRTARKIVETEGDGLKLSTPWAQTHDGGGILDMIFSRGFVIRTEGKIYNPGGLSDHRGVVAQLTLKGSK